MRSAEVFGDLAAPQSGDWGALRPFIRWAGSKQKLLKHILPLVPKQFGTYYEPFLGSGAMFLSIRPYRAVLSDRSKELIELYGSLRDNVEAVIRFLAPLRQNKREYYRIRSQRSEGRFK